MNDSVRSHPLASELLRQWRSRRVSFGPSIVGLPCQIRLDWIAPDYGIVDLKTSDNLTWFEADARRFRYLHQLAFYRAIVAKRLAKRCRSTSSPLRNASRFAAACGSSARTFSEPRSARTKRR